MSKPKVGFYWCASCGGCEESVVDLAEDILAVVAAVEFVFFPVAMDFKRSDVEAMADGEMAVCFINGAVRSSEQREMVHLLRRKSQLIVAYGSCSGSGGVPGLANMYTRESLMQCVYEQIATNANPEHVRPQHKTRVPEGELELPTLDAQVRALDQVIEVDYYLPGCAPPTPLLKDAVMAILSGKLPPKGAVLAPDKALCDGCPRIDSKPDRPLITGFKRPHQMQIDPDLCLLAQGLLCMGPATRGGCDWACIRGNMPCTGCMGPVSGSRDQGAAAMAALASMLDYNDPEPIIKAVEQIPDPAGTFYRYGMPASMLYGKHGTVAQGGD